MSTVDELLPPDDWLAPADGELADRKRHLAEAEYDAGPVISIAWEEASEGVRERLQAAKRRCDPPPKSALEEAFSAAESLEPDDRLRLIERLWRSLPLKQRDVLVQSQLEAFEKSNAERVIGGAGESFWPILRRALFDSAEISRLYSAPRRFDLATVFVVTAAYSLLFGSLSALGFGPAAKIALGVLVTVVAAAQGLFHGRSNPRGVSVVAGAVSYSLVSLVLWSVYPRSFPNSFLFVAVFNGLIGGAFLGYLAGVLVGGVFLFADFLRVQFGRDAPLEPAGPSLAEGADEPRRGDSDAGTEPF